VCDFSAADWNAFAEFRLPLQYMGAKTEKDRAYLQQRVQIAEY
jgi:hypothetical protein